jgi:hypothetical protein
LVVENIAAGVEAPLFALLEQVAPLRRYHQVPLRNAQSLPPVLPDLVSRVRALLPFAFGRRRRLADGPGSEAVRRPPACRSQSVVAHAIRSLERSPEAIRDFVAGRCRRVGASADYYWSYQ